jgi:MscS family membrane protein
MKMLRFLILGLALGALPANHAAEPAAPQPAATAPATPPAGQDAARPAVNPAYAGVAAPNHVLARPPQFIEHLVDVTLQRFDAGSTGNTAARYIVAALLLMVAVLLRHVVTKIMFGFLKRLAAHTETTLDDKLFAALETPAATLVIVVGAVWALEALKFSESTDNALGYVYTVAFSLVFFWLVMRAFNTVLNHLHEVAQQRNLGIAAFMPWIKKSLVTVFVIFGALLIAQSLGADVKAFLAGLGIGGLAFALAAQDTIANIFGSVVVAMDQPFKLGEYVQIGDLAGTVEDIGLRSTKLRTAARTLIVVPNKTVAAAAITNYSRMPQRRVEQKLGLTYNTTPEQMEGILDDIRRILREDPDVHQDTVVVNFADYAESSLDIQVIYFAANPDWVRHMMVRERINLKIMRAVAARGLFFAFPTQTLHVDDDVARKLAGAKPAMLG